MLDPYKSSQIQTNNFSSPPPNTFRAFACKTGPSRDLRSPQSKRLKTQSTVFEGMRYNSLLTFLRFKADTNSTKFSQIPFWSVIIWKTEGFSECKILFVLWTNRAVFSPYFPWQYFRVNSLHRDHFTQLEDPLQTETTKVASATSDCVDCCQVLYYQTECWHQWKHNEKEKLL